MGQAILLTDDNETDRLITRLMLFGKHYQDVASKSGSEAPEIFTQKKSCDLIVVLDIFLSDSVRSPVATKVDAKARCAQIIIVRQISRHWGRIWA